MNRLIYQKSIFSPFSLALQVKAFLHMMEKVHIKIKS